MVPEKKGQYMAATEVVRTYIAKEKVWKVLSQS